MTDSFIEYKQGKEGHLPRMLTTLSENEKEHLVYESKMEMSAIREVSSIGDLLSEPTIQPLIEYILPQLGTFGLQLDFLNFYEYEGLPLTLYHYLLLRGESENDSDLLALAHDVEALLAVAIATVKDLPIRPEMALHLYISGRRAGSLTHYKAINREEPFHKKNEDNKKEIDMLKHVIQRKDRHLQEKFPDASKRERAALLAEDPEISRSERTIRKYI
ncbi:hypothetical protein [Vibrio alfacsensis]|uniref:hypothetical protein n=1 Tax=Vibrio alfacsensis TaxID=1074311 RepID=UPI0040694092